MEEIDFKQLNQLVEPLPDNKKFPIPKWRVFLGVFLLIILGVVAYLTVAVYQSFWPFQIPEYNLILNDGGNIVGGDRDAHGCIGSAGYSWCEEKQKCLRVWEESCEAAISPTPDSSGIACTQEAKLCPDGSYVGRSGPNCEFRPCPSR